MSRRSMRIAAVLFVLVLSSVPGCSRPSSPSSDLPPSPGSAPPSGFNDHLCTLPAVAEVWQGGAAPTCLVGGWCASYPPLQGFSLRALGGLADDDLWAAGDGHLLLHWDGQDYQTLNSPGEGELEALWGPSADDLWGVGTLGTLIHWDGVTWARVCSPTGAALHALSGTAHDDVWAVGDSTLLHFDGQTWSRVMPQRLDFTPWAVLALARDDVWVSGAQRVEHWDGRTWSDMSPPDLGALRLHNLWGTGPSDVWLSDRCSNERSCGSPDRALEFSAYHWDGRAWTRVLPDTLIVGMGGSTPNNGWGFIGNRLFHWDGTSWRELPSPSNTHVPIHGLVATAHGDYGLSTHLIQRVEGASWASLGGGEVKSISVSRIVQRTAEDAWVVGSVGLELFTAHFEGVRWNPQSKPGTPAGLKDVALPGPMEVWGLEDRTVQHWNGTSWDYVGIDVPSYTGLHHIWGSAADDVWVTGWRLTHYGRSVPAPNDSDFDQVGGTSPTNVWVTTTKGALWHWDGAAWSKIPRDPSNTLSGLWVAAEDDVWTTEGIGLVARWDGKAWTRFSIPGARSTGEITGRDSSDVWISIDGGLAHWDGASWSLHLPPRGLPMKSITSRGPGEVWIGTNEGILSYKSPEGGPLPP